MLCRMRMGKENCFHASFWNTTKTGAFLSDAETQHFVEVCVMKQSTWIFKAASVEAFYDWLCVAKRLTVTFEHSIHFTGRVIRGLQHMKCSVKHSFDLLKKASSHVFLVFCNICHHHLNVQLYSKERLHSYSNYAGQRDIFREPDDQCSWTNVTWLGRLIVLSSQLASWWSGFGWSPVCFWAQRSCSL